MPGVVAQRFASRGMTSSGAGWLRSGLRCSGRSAVPSVAYAAPDDTAVDADVGEVTVAHRLEAGDVATDPYFIAESGEEARDGVQGGSCSRAPRHPVFDGFQAESP